MTLGRSQSAAPLPLALLPGLGLEPEGPAAALLAPAAGGVAVAGVAGEEEGDEPDTRWCEDGCCSGRKGRERREGERGKGVEMSGTGRQERGARHKGGRAGDEG